MKKIIIFAIIFLNAIGVYVYIISNEAKISKDDRSIFKEIEINKEDELDKLAKDYPELKELVEKVKKNKAILVNDKESIINYTNLGLAWKSLADYAMSYKVEDYKEYYKQAQLVYEEAIEKTNRLNTLFLVNAAKMAIYNQEFSVAEDFFKESIVVARGDAVLYAELAELYEYHMSKTKEEILEVYDLGIKNVVQPTRLEKRKQEYINRGD